MTRVLARTAQIAVGLLVLAVLTGRSQAGDAKKVYKSAQEVFDAFVKAADKDDIKTVMGCFTAAYSDEIAGMGVMFAVTTRLFPTVLKDEEKAKYEAVWQKHGLTEEVVKKLAVEHKQLFTPRTKGSPPPSSADIRQLATAVKDRVGFSVDFLTAAGKGGKRAKEESPFKVGMLKEVQIDGDSAKGVVVSTKDGMESRMPLEFRREDGCWRIVPPALLK